MKIEIEIPDWPEEEKRHLFIMAGIDLIAYKYWNEPWKIKTDRCSKCGKCCSGLKNTDDFSKFPQVVDNKCVYLKSDGERTTCELGLWRPFKCCVSIPSKDYCSQKFD